MPNNKIQSVMPSSTGHLDSQYYIEWWQKVRFPIELEMTVGQLEMTVGQLEMTVGQLDRTVGVLEMTVVSLEKIYCCCE